MLRVLSERAIEMQKDLYVCFIDYTKDFDRVRHDELMELLQALDIEGKDLRLIRNLYWEQTAAVRIEGEVGIFGEIRRGVRQGYPFYPDLFNYYSEIILRAIEGMPGVTVGGVNLNNFRFADDTALIADSEEKLQNLIDVVVEESEKIWHLKEEQEVAFSFEEQASVNNL